MKSSRFLTLAASLLFVATSCEKTIIEQVNGNGLGEVYSIEGYAQKGPFIVGTDVTVSELNEQLFPTGRVFFATILDDEGHFNLPGIILESPFIQIKVQGLSFSEVSGGVQLPGELTLYSIADIRESETINVNILTHLEKERVEYLVQEGSKSFNEAKAQALEELLAVFSLDDYTITSPEELSILSENEGNAVLLTISSIIEGIVDYEKKLALITSFREDFRDGVLNSVDIQNKLLTSAVCLNPQQITDNLTNKFSNATIPDFEPILKHFIDNSEYTNYFKDIFNRPQDGSINLLKDFSDISNLSHGHVLFINPPQGIEVSIYINLSTAHYLDEGSFDATDSFPLWYDVSTGGSCPPPPSQHCWLTSRHLLATYGNNLDPIEIPITLTGNGEMGLDFSIIIDGFSNPNISFTKNSSW